MTRLAAILDANVLAPGLVSKTSSSAEIVRLWRLGIFDVPLASKLVEEIAKTLRALALGESDIVELLELLAPDPRFVIPLTYQRMGSPDDADDYLFELAIASGASFIVTRDKALLTLPSALQRTLDIAGVRVVTDLQFLAYLRRHLFSPFAYDDRLINLEDVLEPLDIPCVVCGHGFHWGFECGAVLDCAGEPLECVCPTAVELQPL